MSDKDTAIVLAWYFAGVLLLWSPIIADTIRQERKISKRGRK